MGLQASFLVPLFWSSFTVSEPFQRAGVIFLMLLGHTLEAFLWRQKPLLKPSVQCHCAWNINVIPVMYQPWQHEIQQPWLLQHTSRPLLAPVHCGDLCCDLCQKDERGLYLEMVLRVGAGQSIFFLPLAIFPVSHQLSFLLFWEYKAPWSFKVCLPKTLEGYLKINPLWVKGRVMSWALHRWSCLNLLPRASLAGEIQYFYLLETWQD